MRIVCDKTLARFRGPGICEYCLKRVKKRHPHHIHTRGAGRLDTRINLIALCETFAGGDNCHDRAHHGTIERAELLEIVAAREELRAEVIVAAIHRLRRLPQPVDLMYKRTRKKKAKPSAWQVKAAELGRAKRRADYQRLKAWRKKKG